MSLLRCALLLACAWGLCGGAWGQSSDLNAPTPVLADQIDGRVAPRDLGDPRLTSHFYTFNGTQGDLVLTVESLNLEGAVDLFLLAGLRPLTQIALFAEASAQSVSKTVFLRREEILVLRVRARTPNDADGTYRIRFSGTFLPSTNVAAAPPQPETTAAAPRPPAKGTRRVNSVGARIDEPEPAAPAPELKAADEKESEAAAAEAARPPRPSANRTRPPRRSRPTPRSETARRPTTTQPGETETAKTETGEAAPTESVPKEPMPNKTAAERAPRARTGRPTRVPRAKETARRTGAPAKEGTPAEGAEAESPPAPQIGVTRLVIETKDGAKVEHEMSNVSRVTVVSQLIVVTLKNGRIERYPLTNVLRMAIEP